MRVFTITGNDSGQRFDKYLKKLLKEAPAGFVYKMLRKKNIVLNGKKADGTEKLLAGDEVKVFLSEETFEKFTGSRQKTAEYDSLRELNVKLEVLYEDEDILIINKPSGMLSQKAKPEDISANEYILAYLIKNGALTEERMHTFRPSICNRLDRNTSGILIAGKTLKGLQEMSEALRTRSVRKYYRCLVEGELTKPAYLKGWLKKDEVSNKVTVFAEQQAAGEGALPIETEYLPLKTNGSFTYLEVHLITGRSHQIRAHLASTGHPIVGDFKYNKKAACGYGRRQLHVNSQLLHACRLEFAEDRVVTAPLPKEFERVLRSVDCWR